MTLPRATAPPTGEPAPSAGSRTYKVLALSLGSVLSMLAGIALGMVAARLLSKHDYATLRQTFLVYEFAAPLLILGLPNALYYFLPRTGTDRRGVLVDNLALLCGLGILFALFLLLGGQQLLADRFDNPDLRQTLPWMVAYPLLMTPIAGMAAAMVVAGRVRELAVFNVVSSLVLALAGIAAIQLTRSFEAPVLARIVVSAVALPVGLWLMFRAHPGPLRAPRWASMDETLRYAAPLGLATMLGTLTMQLHAVVVAAMCSPEQFAIYINGAVEIPIIGIVAGSITTVIFADMSAACARGDKPEALRLFQVASHRSACILMPTMFFFAVSAEAFIVFMFSSNYRDSTTPFLIYLTVLPARIVVWGAAMMALGMSRAILLRSTADLAVNAVFCYLFVTAFGYVGAAIGLAATLYIWTVPFNMAKIAQGFGVHWTELLPWRRLAGVSAIALAALPIAVVTLLLSAHWPTAARLAMALTCYGVAYGYWIYRAQHIDLPVTLTARLPALLRRRNLT
jgi:O-antigen/teichoic acid export membrane protein